ncbi:MAG: threonylcarbamoyl-AMP synthase [Gammaproteobacteria bacterium]|nr:threonylcarbamoyl-AMP synthase [Gammaproteobacteria bacterium]
MNTLEQAVALLREGGVIAYPTETVFGLGCDPDNEAAVLRLLHLKQRAVEKGLILIAATVDQFEKYIDANTFDQYPHVLNSWPGANTWLVPCKVSTPRWLCGQFDTLAVRVIDHPVATKLCKLFAAPIVSTSANVSGLAPAMNAAEVRKQFPTDLDYILEGSVGKSGSPSAIRDARTQQQIR